MLEKACRAVAALAIALTAFTLPARAADGAAPGVSHDPYAARLVTADIDRFWTAFDTPEPGRASAFEHYLAEGTPGLRDFIPYRIRSAGNLARVTAANAAYYRAVRASTLRVRDYTPAIRRAFARMAEILGPEAVFLDVYFVVGATNSGGTATANGLIIGTEVDALPANHDAAACVNLAWLCANAAPVEYVPFIVAHELVHAEQDALGHPAPAAAATLLRAVLTEGVADYVAERATGLPPRGEYVTFGRAHAAEVRDAFLAVRGSLAPAARNEFLYNDPAQHPGWPHDLGYDVGYRIARGYVARRHDDRAAIRELVQLADPERILAASGYADGA